MTGPTTTDYRAHDTIRGPMPECTVPPPLTLHFNHWGSLTLKHVHLLPAVYFQFHLEERWVWMCKLGVTS